MVGMAMGVHDEQLQLALATAFENCLHLLDQGRGRGSLHGARVDEQCALRSDQ
jgi:hypothetical protein